MKRTVQQLSNNINNDSSSVEPPVKKSKTKTYKKQICVATSSITNPKLLQLLDEAAKQFEKDKHLYSNFEFCLCNNGDMKQVTHLVVGNATTNSSKESSPPKRTIKSIFAVAKGAFILDSKWIYALHGYLMRNSSQRDTIPHITNSTQAVDHEEYFEITSVKGPRKSRLEHCQVLHKGLFENIIACFHHDTKPEKLVLEQILLMAGGKVTHSWKECNVVICGEGSTLQPTKELDDVPLVTDKWMLTSLYDYYELLPLHPFLLPQSKAKEMKRFVSMKSTTEESSVENAKCCRLRFIGTPTLYDGPQLIFLSKPSTLFGRSGSHVDVVIGEKDAQSLISRTHAVITQDFDEQGNHIFCIKDLKSLNGVFVNKKRVQQCTISDGDVIHFGGGYGNRIAFEEVVPHVQSNFEFVFEKAKVNPVLEKARLEEERLTNELSLVRKALLERNQIDNQLQTELFKLKHQLTENESKESDLKQQIQELQKQITNTHQKSDKVHSLELALQQKSQQYALQQEQVQQLQQRLKKISSTKSFTSSMLEKPSNTNQYPNNTVLIVDTNQFLLYPNLLQRLKSDYVCIIACVVIAELDGLKKSEDKRIAYSARQAIQSINECLQDYKSENRCIVRGQLACEVLSLKEGGFDPITSDDQILNCAMYYNRCVAHHRVKLVSKDKNLCNKAIINRLQCVQDITSCFK